MARWPAPKPTTPPLSSERWTPPGLPEEASWRFPPGITGSMAQSQYPSQSRCKGHSAPPTDRQGEDPKLDGSVLLAYAGRGDPAAAPFIRLTGSMATLSGFIVAYPEWKESDVPPVPYPPTVYASGSINVAVLDCCFLNSYEALHFQDSHRFLVRNVYGYPSCRGLYVDNCLDIGRVENCHFWPFGINYGASAYTQWINENGVAFEFARTDWQYVTNTFCFGFNYKFSTTCLSCTQPLGTATVGARSPRCQHLIS